MNCKPCGKSFTGIVPYTQHVEGEKHGRKVSSLKILGLPNQVECMVCHTSFDSVQSYHNHSCKNQNNCSRPGTISSSTGNDSVSADCSDKDQSSLSIDESGQYTECKTCNKKFSGSVPYVMHVASTAHKRKVEMENFNLSAEGTEEDSNTFSCDLCKKVFSGPEPYKQHLAGAAHKKMEKGNNSGAKTTETFSCEPCKKVFSGQVPYNIHLGSAVHKKKLKLIALTGQLSENDEIGSDSECHSPQNKNANTNWFCKFCRIQCSGLIPYKQHLQGDNHFKNARIVTKHDKESKNKVKNVPTGLLDATNEENADIPKAFSPVNSEGNEGIEIDLTQVLESLKPPDELDLNNFFSVEKVDVDICEKKKVDSGKEILKKVSVDKEVKNESYSACKVLLSKEDVLSHKSSAHIIKEKKSTKRLHSENKEKIAKKFCSK